MSEHATIGHLYACWDGEFRCIAWFRDSGYQMVTVKPNTLHKVVGEEFSVSEHAIGRTFHRVRQPSHLVEDTSVPVPHAPGCNCWICEGRPGC